MADHTHGPDCQCADDLDDEAMRIVKAGIEAQVVDAEKITLVIIGDADARVGIACVAASPRLAAVADALVGMALIRLRQSDPKLVDRVEKVKA